MAEVHKSKVHGSDLRLSMRVPKPAAQAPAEARAFDYFLTCVAPSLAGGIDGDFWTLVLPQISESDRGVRHAVLAISELYEHPPKHHWTVQDPDNATAIAETRSSQALTWYNQSLKSLQQHLSNLRDADKAQLALLSCVLFTSLEFQQNNVQNALKLLGRGYDVYALASESSGYESRRHNFFIEDTLVPMFTRHVVLMALFGHQPSHHWTQRFQRMMQHDLTPATTLREARMQLYICVCRAMALVHATGTLIGSQKEGTLETLQVRQDAVVEQLRRWHTDFKQLLNRIEPPLTTVQRSAALMLLMYFHDMEIWTLTCLDPSPMVFDEHFDSFELVVQYGEEALKHAETSWSSGPPPFSFEMGLIPPLHFVGWKCHHPLLRRRALALIQRAPAQEALFSADLNYRATKKIIEVEEGADHLPFDLVHFRACLDAGAKIIIPKEEDRVNGAAVHYENDGQKVPPLLVYTKGRLSELPAWAQKAQTVLI